MYKKFDLLRKDHPHSIELRRSFARRSRNNPKASRMMGRAIECPGHTNACGHV
jgi:hypothetical protein